MTGRAPPEGLPNEGPARDAELMRRVAGGDTGGLGELYDLHCRSLRRFLCRATGDAEDVDDLVHATFLAAAKSASRYDGRLSCRPWLMGIAAQLLRRRRRTFGRLLALVSSIGSQQTATADPRPALQARTDVDRALRTLSEPKRIAFLMAEVEGLTCPEIAETLAIPVGTVWTRLHAARRELRRALEGDEP